jgi:hypothetical protein
MLPMPKVAPFKRRAPMGKSTTRDSIVTVIPKLSPRPGIGDRWIRGLPIGFSYFAT